MPPPRRNKTKRASTSNSAAVHDIEDDQREVEPIEERLPQDVPATSSTSDTSNKLNSYSVVSQALYNNFLFKVGDIVSLRENNCTYYAQIRVLVEDSFSEKYVALIWLLPTSEADFKGDFNPYTFTYGPQDEWFYSLGVVTFVMHAPTEFYKRFISPVPRNSDLNHIVKYKFKRKS